MSRMSHRCHETVIDDLTIFFSLLDDEIASYVGSGEIKHHQSLINVQLVGSAKINGIGFTALES